jgi:hypothetical protein
MAEKNQKKLINLKSRRDISGFTLIELLEPNSSFTYEIAAAIIFRSGNVEYLAPIVLTLSADGRL